LLSWLALSESSRCSSVVTTFLAMSLQHCRSVSTSPKIWVLTNGSFMLSSLTSSFRHRPRAWQNANVLSPSEIGSDGSADKLTISCRNFSTKSKKQQSLQSMIISCVWYVSTLRLFTFLKQALKASNNSCCAASSFLYPSMAKGCAIVQVASAS